jgi:hypothetical protein
LYLKLLDPFGCGAAEYAFHISALFRQLSGLAEIPYCPLWCAYLNLEWPHFVMQQAFNNL